jgi:hypothetical protein
LQEKEIKVTKAELKKIEKMAWAHSMEDFKWVDPRTIILQHWVRQKCIYGYQRDG